MPKAIRAADSQVARQALCGTDYRAEDAADPLSRLRIERAGLAFTVIPRGQSWHEGGHAFRTRMAIGVMQLPSDVRCVQGLPAIHFLEGAP